MTLAELVAARAWPRALGEAISIWRATRDPVAAHVVDRIAARCERLAIPDAGQLHAWWIAHAADYDPNVATTLLEYLPVRLRSSEARWTQIAERWRGRQIVELVAGKTWDCNTNWIDRYAALESWDDPRLAPILAGWIAGPGPFLAPVFHAGFQRIVGDHLLRLRDVRVVSRLRACSDPAVATLGRALETLPPISAGLAAIAAELDAPTQLEQLWSHVGDRDTRQVLADALLAAGDSRGALIALQLAGASGPDIDRRVRRDWERWLGVDLAAIVVREGSLLRDGLFEVLRVGHGFTPAFAWSAAIGHRELRTVHTVRPAVIADHAAYARFIAALPGLRTLALGTATLEELAAQRLRLAIDWIEPLDALAGDLLREIAPHARMKIPGAITPTV